MTLRVKSDKEYAALLLSLTQQTEKQEAADYISTVSKVRLPDLSNQIKAASHPRSSLTPVCVCGSVLVAGDPSDRGVGSSDEESR